MVQMFKNKILLKATPASGCASPLFLLPLSLRSSSSSSPPESEADPSLSIWLEILCWKLSRKWRLACLPQPSQIFLVYRKYQLDSVDRVVLEIVKLAPTIHVGIEEEVKSGSLTAKAIEIGLKCLMLGHKWSCIGDATFVDSTFDTDQERTNFPALNVKVQCGSYDEFVCVVSPDTLRFTRHKFSDLVNSRAMDIFENNKEVTFESYDYSTACTTLPLLYEGYVRGLSKVLPEGQCFDMIQELWSIKHGLALQSSNFVAVQYSDGDCMNKQWFPCSFVLQGSGLTAVPKTIRGSKAKSAYESFIKILEAWDFFGGGPLIVIEQSLIGNGPSILAWEKATSNPPHCIPATDSICKDLLSALDFRTSKPDMGYKDKSIFVSDGDADSTKISCQHLASKNNTLAVESTLSVKLLKEQALLLVPSFSKNERTNAPKNSGQARSKATNNSLVKASHECHITVNGSKNTMKHEKMNESLLTSNSEELCPKAQVVDQPPMIMMPSFTKNKKASTQRDRIHPSNIARTVAPAPVKKNQNPKIMVNVARTVAPAPVKKNQNPEKKISCFISFLMKNS